MITKKLTLLATIILILSSSVTNAQEPLVRFNFRGGLNFTTFGGDLDHTKTVVKEQVGIGADILVVENVYLLTGVDYQAKGTKVKPKGGHHIKYHADYLQVPLHAAYKMKLSHKVKFVALSGPYFAYGIGGKIKGEEKVNTFGDGRLKKFDLGISFALGIDLPHNTFKIGYDCGLKDISDMRDTKIRNRNMYITSGYVF